MRINLEGACMRQPGASLRYNLLTEGLSGEEVVPNGTVIVARLQHYFVVKLLVEVLRSHFFDFRRRYHLKFCLFLLFVRPLFSQLHWEVREIVKQIFLAASVAQNILFFNHVIIFFHVFKAAEALLLCEDVDVDLSGVSRL